MIIKVIINKAFFTLNPLPTTPLHPISKHDNSNPTLTPPPLLHHLHNYSTPTYITTPATTPITTSTRTTQHNQTYNLQSPSPPPQPDPPNSIDPTTTHHPPNHLTPTPSSTINLTPLLNQPADESKRLPGRTLEFTISQSDIVVADTIYDSDTDLASSQAEPVVSNNWKKHLNAQVTLGCVDHLVMLNI